MAYDVQQEITNNIIKALKDGIDKGDKWELPWHRVAVSPINGTTGKAYRGLNIFILALSGYSNPFWAGLKQWKAIGAIPLEGQYMKGTLISAPIMFKSKEMDSKGKPKMVFSGKFRPCWIHNIDQMDMSKVKDMTPFQNDAPITEFHAHKLADSYVANTGAIIEGFDANRAFYSPSRDVINMPPKTSFKSQSGYYATLLHELIHWTGHESRCDRNLKNQSGSKDYAKEELVAEMGAAFLTMQLGVVNELREDHAKYLGSWLKALGNDKTFIFKAGTLASKAASYLDGLQAVKSDAEEKVAA